MDSIDDFHRYNYIVLMYNLCFFGELKVQEEKKGTHDVLHTRQSQFRALNQ